MKKRYLLIFIGILLVVSLLMGTSYAYWMMNHKQTNENVVNSGCFSTTFTENAESAINLTNSFPMLDKDGMTTKPYEFTIQNTCDIYANYNINLELLNTTTLSHDLIKAVLNDGTPKVATYFATTNATIDGATAYTILSGGLNANESRTFNFRMWIDESATVDNAQNKGVNAKIVVVTSATNNPDLIDTLLAQYDEENTEYGLLRDNENPDIYYYKGTREQVANNYIWYGGHQWQVIEFNTKDRTLRLRTSQPITNIAFNMITWKNEEEYNNSYLMSWLKEEFYDKLPNEIKNNIINSIYNVGIETDVDSIIATNKYGLLDVEEYKRTGGADSFLDNKDYMVFPNEKTDNKLIATEKNGNLELTFSPGQFNEVLPVITIKDVNISSGLGTLKNSFVISSNKSISTSDVLIGEYISVPTSGSYCGDDNMCLFRVVKYGESALKVTLNGTLPELKNYLPDPIITKEHEIYRYVGEFVESISANYKSNDEEKIYMSRTFTSEEILAGKDNYYKNFRNDYLQSSYGLPSLTEMFSANDIDLFSGKYVGTSNIFTDSSVIENFVSNVDENIYADGNYSMYSLMNKCGHYDNSGYINFNGYSSGNSIDVEILVRPVMHLKYDLEFTGGSGTAQDPYTLD